MVNIKNFDYFRKTDQTENTRIGGLVSILSMTVSTPHKHLTFNFRQYLCSFTRNSLPLWPQWSPRVFLYQVTSMWNRRLRWLCQLYFPKRPAPVSTIMNLMTEFSVIDMQISTGYTTLMRQDLEKEFKFTRIKGKSMEVIGPSGNDADLASS